MSHRPGERVVNRRFGNIRNLRIRIRCNRHYIARSKRYGVGAVTGSCGVECCIAEVYHIFGICMGATIVCPSLVLRFHIQHRGVISDRQRTLRFADCVVAQICTRICGVAERVGTATNLSLRSRECICGAVITNPARLGHKAVSVLARHVIVCNGRAVIHLAGITAHQCHQLRTHNHRYRVLQCITFRSLVADCLQVVLVGANSEVVAGCDGLGTTIVLNVTVGAGRRHREVGVRVGNLYQLYVVTVEKTSLRFVGHR